MSNGAVESDFGICGKIPSRGDFLSQGLPLRFVDSWNEWLQAVVAVSRDQLGESWLDKYLTSPIWNFALSSRVCGDMAMAGTLIPSVDQVGRHYPFSIVKSVSQSPIQMWNDQTWGENLEPWILDALDDEFSLESWFEKLSSEDLGWPEGERLNALVSNSRDNQRGSVLECETEGGELNLLGLLHQSYRDQFDRYCLWWTQGSEEVAPCLLVTEGLPQVSQYSAMLDGDWDRWGWQKKQIVC